MTGQNSWLIPNPWLSELANAAKLSHFALLDLEKAQQNSSVFMEDLAAFDAWIEAGAHAGMRYMEENREARTDARKMLPTARTALVFFVPYATGLRVRGGKTFAPSGENAHPQPENETSAGLVARYARGRDYHRTLRKVLDGFSKALNKKLNRTISARVVTDSAPWLERAHARAAGLGFVGKNTMLIRPGLGSFGFLTSLLLDAPAAEFGVLRDRPHPMESLDCGDCTRCLDACPTQAFSQPYFLDANRCLAYFSIEHRGAVPAEFQTHFQKTIFGCDICQEVCPYNFVTLNMVELLEFQKPHLGLSKSIVEIARMTVTEYERWFGGTSMTRAKYSGLVRNALYSLRASGDGALAEVVRDLRSRASPELNEILEDF